MSDEMKKVLFLFMLFFLLPSTLTVAQRRIILKKNAQKVVKGEKTVKLNVLTQDTFCGDSVILGYDSKITYVVKYDDYIDVPTNDGGDIAIFPTNKALPNVGNIVIQDVL